MGGKDYTAAFRQLTAEANDAGLMRRRYGYYWTRILFWTLATVGILIGVVLLGDTWFQLILAALLGLAMAQLGFLGHEAAHQGVYASTGWNEWVSRIIAGLLTGLSYRWWTDKHNRHHANPNKEREDPDAEPGVLSFTPEGTDRRTGFAAKLGKYQGFYFPPLLLFEGFSLHIDSIRTILTEKNLEHRWTEILFVGIRIFGYLALLFIVLPPGMAIAFVGVQVAVFGVLLGGAFSPNHIGMPTVPHDADIDFLRRQVRMSRSIRGGPLVHLPARPPVPELNQETLMKVTANPTTCIASGNCSRTAPRVFANRDEDDGFVSVLDEHPPESEWEAVREAEDLCPSATIQLERDDD